MSEPISSVAMAIKEALSLIRDLMDPENQKNLEYVKKLRNLGRAVNYAEKAFGCIDEMIKLERDSKGWEKCYDRYKSYKEKFNKYD